MALNEEHFIFLLSIMVSFKFISVGEYKTNAVFQRGISFSLGENLWKKEFIHNSISPELSITGPRKANSKDYGVFNS